MLGKNLSESGESNGFSATVLKATHESCNKNDKIKMHKNTCYNNEPVFAGVP